MSPTDGSIVRRRASDVRLFGAAGYALVLQVAHPTIAAGVRDHSGFATDPWGRFFRTADYLNLVVYGPPETVRSVATRLRAMHGSIRGTDPGGRPYDALEPSAYAWVHATLAEAIVRGHQLFGRPLDAGERDQFWAEWRELGATLGIGPHDLPAGWSDFQRYLARMVDEILEDNDVVQSVLRTADRAVGGSPFPWLDQRLWAMAGWPLGRYGRFLTVGTTPRPLRAKLGLAWSPLHEAVFGVIAAGHRASEPVLPRRLKRVGPLALRMRRREIAVGPFGGGIGGPQPTTPRTRLPATPRGAAG